MKKFFLMCLLFILTAVYSQALDIAEDKAFHLFIGYGTGCLATRLVDDMYIRSYTVDPITFNRTVIYHQKDFWYGALPIIAIIGIATLKEATDSATGGSGWNWGDWAYTCVGGFGGIITIRL